MRKMRAPAHTYIWHINKNYYKNWCFFLLSPPSPPPPPHITISYEYFIYIKKIYFNGHIKKKKWNNKTNAHHNKIIIIIRKYERFDLFGASITLLCTHIFLWWPFTRIFIIYIHTIIQKKNNNKMKLPMAHF